MIYRTVFFLLIILKVGILQIMHCKSTDISDYFWREYNGVIPYDALRGGLDKLNQPAYIGQGSIYEIGSIPASIYPGNRTAVASSGKIYYLNDNTKILCSGSPQKFKWIPTTVATMSSITNCEIISGGLDYEDEVYIGRAQNDGELKLGKVIKKWNALLVPENGKEVHIPNFELLVYDCHDNEIRTNSV